MPYFAGYDAVSDVLSASDGRKFRAGFGFTLAELIVVIAILAVLTTVGLVAFSGYVSDSEDSARLTEMGLVTRAVELSATTQGSYPKPVSSESVPLVAFTGSASGKTLVTQGAVTAENVKELSASFGKTKSTGPIVYSVLGNGTAFQIAAEFDGSVSAVTGTDTAYADSKTAYVKGTYAADPSLPSLITSSGSVGSGGIFSPSTCFVTDGGHNLVSSSAGCVPKSATPLVSLDSGLMGYWDMETVCQSGVCGGGNDGRLKDLSGNGNHGALMNGLAPGSAFSLAGKAAFFNSGSLQLVRIPESPSLRDLSKAFSISVLFKTDFVQHGVFLYERYSSGTTRDYAYGSYLSTGAGSGYVSTYYKYGPTLPEAHSSGNNFSYRGSYHVLVSIFDGAAIRTYVDGNLISNSVIADSSSVISTPGDAFIGGWVRSFNASTGTFFHGILDEVKVYNRTLSEQEVIQQSQALGLR